MIFLTDKQYVIIVLLFSAFAYAAPNVENNKLTNNDNSLPSCDENGDCLSTPQDCHEICGCDRSGFMAMQYNETTKTCVVSFKHLMIAEINIYGSEDDSGDEEGSTITGSAMAKRIRMEAERIFNTIMVSVILFISCCAVCVVSACCYCCRISYADYALQKDVKALAKKLQRDGKYKKMSKKPPQAQTQATQSCNIICEDAGIFVV